MLNFYIIIQIFCIFALRIQWYMRKVVFVLSVLIAILSSCSNSEKVYKIAVSQCSPGEWRDKVNQEMLATQSIYDRCSVAGANCEVQVRSLNRIW